MMALTLVKSASSDYDYNFTMSIFGDVFVSSVSSSGYFGMPAQCFYERNHTGGAFLNLTSGVARFTISDTTTDNNM